VGLLISEAAGKRQPRQIWIKRPVLEMGGKDATIVDEEADLDAAVEGVAPAALGYQGRSARRVRAPSFRIKCTTHS
jgi:1-pyrroline-5-carboxylate dehydrogenase